MGDKVDIIRSLAPGSTVKVLFNAESREYNSKWYTDLTIWKIEISGGSQNTSPNAPGEDYFRNVVPPAENSQDVMPDDLPF
jgi:hypothetical protein